MDSLGYCSRQTLCRNDAMGLRGSCCVPFRGPLLGTQVWTFVLKSAGVKFRGCCSSCVDTAPVYHV